MVGNYLNGEQRQLFGFINSLLNFTTMSTKNITNYWEKLSELQYDVCNEICENLKRINKENITEDDGFDGSCSFQDSYSKISEIDNEGNVLIQTESDEYKISIYSDDWAIQDLIHILRELRNIK